MALRAVAGTGLQGVLDVGKAQRRRNVRQGVIDLDLQLLYGAGGRSIGSDELHDVGAVHCRRENRQRGRQIHQCCRSRIAHKTPLVGIRVKAHGRRQRRCALPDDTVRPRVGDGPFRCQIAIAESGTKQVVRHRLELADGSAELVVDQLGQGHVAAIHDMGLDPVLVSVKLLERLEADVGLIPCAPQQVADAAGRCYDIGVQRILPGRRPAGLYVGIVRARHGQRQCVASVHVLEVCRRRSLIFVPGCHASAEIFRLGAYGPDGKRERTQDHLVDFLDPGLLLGTREAEDRRIVKSSRLERMQTCLHVAAVLRKRVHDQREQALAGAVRRCQRVAAPPMAGYTHGGHRLGRTTIQADRAQTCTGLRVKGIELDEVRPGRSVRPRAEFNRVGAQMPLTHTLYGCLQVERRVAAVSAHEVVVHYKGHRAVRVLVRRHAPTVPEVAHVADDHAVFFLPAAGVTNPVGRLPLVQCVLGIGRVDGLIVGSGIFGRAHLEFTSGVHDRVGIQEETVESSGHRCGTHERVDVTRHGRAATAAAASHQQHAQGCRGGPRNRARISHHHILT